MLLAAGEGRRLGDLALDCPKPMLEIDGRPILEHNIRLLARHGIRDIIINLHHRPEAIEERFADGAALGVCITYSREPVLLGTAGAVAKVSAAIDGSLLVLYADNLTTCNLDRLIAFHKAKGGTATMAVYHRENPLASGIVGLDADDRVLRFLEKPRPEEVFSNWVNAGLLVIEPSVLNFIPRDRASDFGRDVLPAILAAGHRMFGYRMLEPLWWVDTPEDLATTRRAAQSGVLKLP
jgi:NDP-sugar pyrophosphorylase family protein